MQRRPAGALVALGAILGGGLAPILSAALFEKYGVLSERELKRSGEFVVPGICKLVVQKRKARQGRNPATGEMIDIPAKTVVKARIAKQLKDAVLPRK